MKHLVDVNTAVLLIDYISKVLYLVELNKYALLDDAVSYIININSVIDITKE